VCKFPEIAFGVIENAGQNAFEDDDEDDYEDACRTVPSRKGRFA